MSNDKPRDRVTLWTCEWAFDGLMSAVSAEFEVFPTTLRFVKSPGNHYAPLAFHCSSVLRGGHRYAKSREEAVEKFLIDQRAHASDLRRRASQIEERVLKAIASERATLASPAKGGGE